MSYDVTDMFQIDPSGYNKLLFTSQNIMYCGGKFESF